MTGRTPPPEQAIEFMDRAACRGVDQSLFIPDVGARDHRYDPARAICATCPVRIECLEYALAIDESFGMWGGMSPKERNAYREEQRLTRINSNVIAFRPRPHATPGATS